MGGGSQPSCSNLQIPRTRCKTLPSYAIYSSMASSNKNYIALGAALAGVAGLAIAFNRPREYQFQDKVVLITGGSRGLGLVMAREFLKQRARVAICARSEDELESARADLARYGREILAIPCDLTERDSIRNMVRSV